jgi:hypothetical protein
VRTTILLSAASILALITVATPAQSAPLGSSELIRPRTGLEVGCHATLDSGYIGQTAGGFVSMTCDSGWAMGHIHWQWRYAGGTWEGGGGIIHGERSPDPQDRNLVQTISGGWLAEPDFSDVELRMRYAVHDGNKHNGAVDGVTTIPYTSPG